MNENKQSGLTWVISQKIFVSEQDQHSYCNSKFCNIGQKVMNMKTCILVESIKQFIKTDSS